MTVCEPEDNISMKNPIKQEMESIDDECQEQTMRERSNSQTTVTTSSGKGRVLYCRKCEGHGKQSILKSHGPVCPYRFCKCSSCQRLDQKRLNSFNKRNKERLEMARELSQRKERDKDSDDLEIETLRAQPNTTVKTELLSKSTSPALSSGSRTSEENTFMSSAPLLGRSLFTETPSTVDLKNTPMNTAISYDMWHAKNMAEKQRAKEPQIQSVDAIRHQLSMPPFINLIPNVVPISSANSTLTLHSNASSPGQKRPAEDIITIDDDSVKKRSNHGYQTIPLEVVPSSSSGGHTMHTHTSTIMNGTNMSRQPMTSSTPLSPCKTLDGQRYVTLPTIPPISILVPNYVSNTEKKDQEQTHHSAPPSVELKTQTGEISTTTVSPSKASSASNIPRMIAAPFPATPTTSSTAPTQLFPIPHTQPQVQHTMSQQIASNYNFAAPQQPPPHSTATSIVSQPQTTNDPQSSFLGYQQNAQLLQIMQQHIMQTQQQQQQQRLLLNPTQQQKPTQPMVQSQVQAHVDHAHLVLANGTHTVSASSANGVQPALLPQGTTLVTPAMLASMGINMAQVATLTPNGIQAIPGNMINLNQFQTLALAPTSHQSPSNLPPQQQQQILLTSQHSSHPVQSPAQLQPSQQTINPNQPMQLVVPSMALIEQLQQHRLLQQQQVAAANTPTAPPSIPVSTTLSIQQLPVIQQQQQQSTHQILNGVYMPKSQIPISQIDQTQLTQMFIGSQPQANPTLASLHAQTQANNGNNPNKIQITQYMNQLQNLAMLGQGQQIMK